MRIGYACGIRAISTPLPWARDIHPVYGVVKWSDKDNASGYHTRILRVPNDVRLELGAYQRLLLRVSRNFGFDAKWRKIPGFMIEPQRKRPELIRPRSLETYLGNLYPWPCNSGPPVAPRSGIAVHRLRVHGALVCRTGAMAPMCRTLRAVDLQGA